MILCPCEKKRNLGNHFVDEDILLSESIFKFILELISAILQKFTELHQIRSWKCHKDATHKSKN